MSVYTTSHHAIDHFSNLAPERVGHMGDCVRPNTSLIINQLFIMTFPQHCHELNHVGVVVIELVPSAIECEDESAPFAGGGNETVSHSFGGHSVLPVRFL
jgi:hypothetical protein